MIMNLEPDWGKAPVELELAFQTAIESARRGDEQRTPARQTPSRVLRYSAQPMAVGELAALRRARAASGAGTLAVTTGLWTDGVTLTAGVVAGGATVMATTATASRRFIVGQSCLVTDGAFKQSLCTISGMGGGGANTITVSAIDKSFAAGARVYPALVAEAPGQVSGSLVTDGAGNLAVELMEKLDQALPAAVAGDWSNYLDVPLFTAPLPEPNWAEGVSDGTTFDLVRNAYGYGRRELVGRGIAERVVQEFELTLFTAAEILRLESFFRGRLGRCKNFWWPDVVAISRVVDFTDDQLTLRAVDFAGNFAPLGACRGYLAVVDQAGTAHPCAIAGVVDNGDGTETYTLDPAPDLVASGISRVSFLLMVRFDQDVLTLRYMTDTKAQARLALIEVPLEAPA